jgi:hypothetical protein
MGVRLERVGPLTVSGSYATQILAATGMGEPARRLLSVSQIRDGKIARIWTFLLGTTAPFDNALI